MDKFLDDLMGMLLLSIYVLGILLIMGKFFKAIFPSTPNTTIQVSAPNTELAKAMIGQQQSALLRHSSLSSADVQKRFELRQKKQQLIARYQELQQQLEQ